MLICLAAHLEDPVSDLATGGRGVASTAVKQLGRRLVSEVLLCEVDGRLQSAQPGVISTLVYAGIQATGMQVPQARMLREVG